MTVRLPAWLQVGAYSAEIDRSVPTGLLMPSTALTARSGVRHFDGNDLLVKATAPASMQVTINPGMAWISGGYSATQGSYCAVNDATLTVSVSSSDASRDRCDLVVLEVLDEAYTGSSDLAQVRVVPGALATSNALPPTVGGNVLVLAQIYVTKGVTSISSGVVTDLRNFSAAAGGILPVRNAAHRQVLTTLSVGLSVLEIDTRRVYQWNGSTWDYQYGGTAPVVAITMSNNWYNYSPSLGSGWAPLRGTKIGSMVSISGLIVSQNSFTGLQQMITLPAGWAPQTYLITDQYAGPGIRIRADVRSDGSVWAYPGWTGYTVPNQMFWMIDIHYNVINNTVG